MTTETVTPDRDDPKKRTALSNLVCELMAVDNDTARRSVAEQILRAIDASAAIPPAPAVAEPLGFTAGGTLYSVSAEASADDAEAHLSGRLSQLSAMLAMTFGAGFEAFQGSAATTQENYLWACSMLADECEELNTVTESLRARERAAARVAAATEAGRA